MTNRDGQGRTRTWWQNLLETKKAREEREWNEGVRMAEQAHAEEEAEKKRAEELKVQRIKEARHGAWLKCHVALCAEVGEPGNPRARDLERWIGRMAGVNAMGYAALQDIKEMVRGLHLDQARAMLRLALATNVVALYREDEEAKSAMQNAECKVQKANCADGEKGKE